MIENLTNGFWFGRKATADPAGAFLAVLFIIWNGRKICVLHFQEASIGAIEEELQRLFEDLNQLRGNLWLFYSAGRLAQSGFGIDFIAESDVRTPDYRATRASLTVFVEANARSLSHTKIEGLPDILWNVMHGDANSGASRSSSSMLASINVI